MSKKLMTALKNIVAPSMGLVEHSLTRKSTMAVMDETGDTKTLWDPRRPDEVEVARNTFNTLKGKGYMIYKVGADGEKGSVMHEFDPKAEKLIAVPAVVGG
jgi:hypothetical protein